MRRAQFDCLSQPVRNFATNPSFETASGTVNVRTNLATNPSFEAASGTVNVRTNLATNPSFETASGTVTTRTNYCLNPRAVTATLWSYQLGTTESSTQTLETGAGPNGLSGFIRRTINTAKTAGNSGHYRNEVGPSGVAGDSVTCSLWVRSSAGISVNLNTTFRLAGANVTSTAGAPTVLTPNVWTLLSTTGTATGTFDGIQVWEVVPAGSIVPVGGTIDATQMLIEKTTLAQPFFDGSTPAAGDFTYVWSGTANASTSIQQGTLVTGMTSNSIHRISSTDWKLSGSKSLRTIPNGASTDSNSSVEGDTGAMRNGMVAGKTYTISATCRLTAPQTGSPNARARSIVLFTRAGVGSYLATQSAAAPNAAGSTRLSLTYTLPTDTTEAFIRLYNGASLGNGDVWWDDLLIEEAGAALTYFDGATAAAGELTHVWSGTANASTSYQQAPGVAAIQSYWAASDWAGYQSSSRPPLSGAKNLRLLAKKAQTFLWGTTAAQAVAVTAGESITLSCSVNPSVTQQFRVNAGFDGGAATAYASFVSCPANTWTRLSHTFTVPAGATLMTVYLNSEDLSTAGATYDFDQFLIEKSATLNAYFDGATLAAGDFTYLWSGAVNASTSIQQAPGVASLGGSTNMSVVQSGAWASAANTKSARVMPKGTGDSFGSITGVTLVTGKTYTVSATCRMDAAQTGTLDARARTIAIYHSGGSIISAQAANVAGSTRLSVTFTVTNGAAYQNIRLYNGASAGGGDVWWDDLMIVEGPYDGPYIDGTKPFSRWDGVAHASSSVGYRS